MKHLAIILLVLTACEMGEFESRYPLADVYKVQDQDRAWLHARWSFVEEFNTHVPNILGPSPEESELWVGWSNTVCPYNDERYAILVDLDDIASVNGFVCKDNIVAAGPGAKRCVAGITFNCSEIYVALDMRTPNRTCGTALAHEYGHCIRMLAGWDPDADHSHDEFWSFIGDTKKENCERDF